MNFNKNSDTNTWLFNTRKFKELEKCSRTCGNNSLVIIDYKLQAIKILVSNAYKDTLPTIIIVKDHETEASIKNYYISLKNYYGEVNYNQIVITCIHNTMCLFDNYLTINNTRRIVIYEPELINIKNLWLTTKTRKDVFKVFIFKNKLGEADSFRITGCDDIYLVRNEKTCN